MPNSENEEIYALFATSRNQKLISGLEKQKKKVLLFPCILTEKIDFRENAVLNFQNPANFDWIIFADLLTVDYFIEDLRRREIDLFELDHLRICALGEAVADRLRFEQIHTDLIPAKIDPEAIFSVISQYLSEDLRGLRFLLVKEVSAKFEAAERLQASGATLAECAVYKARFEDQKGIAKLKTLLRGGAIDEFIFSAPEDLLSLKYLLQEENLAAALGDQKISATDENTFHALSENHLRPGYFHQTSK